MPACNCGPRQPRRKHHRKSVFLLVPLLCLMLLASITTVTSQVTPQQQDQNATTPTTTTPNQAYTQALDLLRSVIEPSALAKYQKHADSIQHSHQASSTRNSDPPESTATTRRSTSPKRTRTDDYQRRLQHQRTRTTLSDLSPYFTFLSSWGPIGTVVRLYARVRQFCLFYSTKIRNLLSVGQTPLSIPFNHKAGTRSAGPASAAEPIRTKVWPGERPATLWPSWEVDVGQASLHGPFLFAADSDLDQQQSQNPFLSSRLGQRIQKAIPIIARSTQPGQEAVAATARRDEALRLLAYAADPPAPHKPSADALWVLSQHHILGTHGIQPQPWLAVPHLTALVEKVDAGNASAHNLLGWLHSSRDLWRAWGGNIGQEQWQGESQSKALLHHTFAAQSGDCPAQMTLAYRSLVGIGTPPDCSEALRWYERAAAQSHIRFKDGPLGGLLPPYTHVRLSDLAGGVYGPGASAASTGWAAHRPAIQAALNSLPSAASAFSADASDPSRLSDLLEFYSYHAAGGSLLYTLRLAQIYYQGSIYGTSESAGRVRRNYSKSRELALRITRRMWPIEVADLKMANGKRVIKASVTTGSAAIQEPEEDLIVKVDSFVMKQAGGAAALLGRMYLRGEGVAEDMSKAWYWFWRGAEVGDRDCQYGFGLMRSLGLAPDQWKTTKDGKVIKKGENIDMKRAVDMWEKAIKAGGMAGHAESSVALGKLHLEMGDLSAAASHFASAVTSGSAFEGFYGLGLVNAKIYRQSVSTLSLPGSNEHRCRAGVTFLKHAAERGDWESPVFHWGLRAWELGDKKRAIVFWSMAAERGDEAAQNNLAYILDRDRRRWKVTVMDGDEDTSTDRLALMYWTRSAAQDNVDALVKLGDYYYHGIGLATLPQAAFNDSHGIPPAPRADYEKALACYATAADRQISALAYWNMGHLYESGLGVPRRDFHLAKRYYDMALEINPEAYFPVMLSLIHLHLKALWATVWKREESAVALFSSYAAGSGTGAGGAVGGYTEAEEEILRSRGREQQQQYDDEDVAGGGDLNLPEAYDVRGRRAEERPAAREQPTGGNDNTDGTSSSSEATLSSLMSLSEEEADAMIDGAMIVIGLSALAMLVYARQAAQNRAEQERREEERRRAGQAGQGVQEQQQPVPPPPGPRYAGGIGWPPDAQDAANQLAGL